MERDNFDLIHSYLSFGNKLDFYFIQILKRKKEHPALPEQGRVIDSFHIHNEYDWKRFMPVIKDESKLNKARAYIYLNRRNEEKIALQTLALIAKNVTSKSYMIRGCYDSCCGKHHSDVDKKWLIDFDIDSKYDENDVVDLINKLQSKAVDRKYFIKGFIPTVSGKHLITNPFDLKEFRKEFPNIGVHKDNPTILYFNDEEYRVGSSVGLEH